MAKLEFVPLRGVDQEWLLIGTSRRWKLECEAIWYEEKTATRPKSSQLESTGKQSSC
jgi:hypothetical protein